MLFSKDALAISVLWESRHSAIPNHCRATRLPTDSMYDSIPDLDLHVQSLFLVYLVLERGIGCMRSGRARVLLLVFVTDGKSIEMGWICCF